MFENPRRGRQVSNFTTNVPKILDLKSSFEQIFFRKLSLGAPETKDMPDRLTLHAQQAVMCTRNLSLSTTMLLAALKVLQLCVFSLCIFKFP